MSSNKVQRLSGLNTQMLAPSSSPRSAKMQLQQSPVKQQQQQQKTPSKQQAQQSPVKKQQQQQQAPQQSPVKKQQQQQKQQQKKPQQQQQKQQTKNQWVMVPTAPVQKKAPVSPRSKGPDYEDLFNQSFIAQILGGGQTTWAQPAPQQKTQQPKQQQQQKAQQPKQQQQKTQQPKQQQQKPQQQKKQSGNGKVESAAELYTFLWGIAAPQQKVVSNTQNRKRSTSNSKKAAPVQKNYIYENNLEGCFIQQILMGGESGVVITRKSITTTNTNKVSSPAKSASPVKKLSAAGPPSKLASPRAGEVTTRARRDSEDILDSSFIQRRLSQ